jgi:hypothetical protein
MQDTMILSVAPVGTVTWKPDLERKLGVIYLANEHGSSHHQSILGNKIDSRRVNYGLAKDWIRHCRADHKGYCTYQPSIATHSIPGFKTIDCETRQVIKHTRRVEYVALSYVWGSGSYASTRSLPNPAFRVIEDAITVTKELGFRYLWIDRYCISQIDASERRHQIAKMDQIYADAVLTIVAAAGEGPDYGLPGVSKTFRRTQPCVIVGNHHLVSSLRSPRDVVMSSKWASRGWTFQEAMLSQRTLFFTDDQISFECASMACQETIHIPLSAAHQKWSASIGRECNTTRIFPPNGPGKSLINILDIIPEYTSRFLTNESDNLKALLGVFNAFRNNQSSHRTSLRELTLKNTTRPGLTQMHQLWGLPILPRTAMGGLGPPIDSRFCAMLAWRSKLPSTRSPGFPSWSWAGWKLPTKVDFLIRKSKILMEFISPNCLVQMWLFHKAKAISFDDLEHKTNFEEILEQAERVLLLRGFVRNFEFRRTEDKRFPLQPICMSNEDFKFWPDVQMNSEEELQRFTEGKWKSLHISYGFFGSEFLVLKQVGDGVYERIGIVEGWCIGKDYLRTLPIENIGLS